MKLIPTFAAIYFLFASLLVNAQSNPCQFNQNNPLSLSTNKTPFVCDGNTVVLETSPSEIENAKYQWKLNDVDIPNATNKTYTASKTGNYSLKVTQGNCEAVSDNKKVYIGELKQVGIYCSNFERYPFEVYPIKAKNIFEIGDGMKLTFRVFGGYLSKIGSTWAIVEDGTSFQWQKNGIDIPKENEAILKTGEVGIYRVKISKGDCISFSKNITIVKGNPKLIKFNLNSSTTKICKGNIINVDIGFLVHSSVISSYPEPYAISDLELRFPTIFNLYKDGKFVKSSSSRNFIFDESGKYHATTTFTSFVTNENYTAYTDTIEVVVQDKVAQFKLQGLTSSCLDSMKLYASNVSDTQKPKYQWKFNGSVLTNETYQDLIIKKSGIYQLDILKENGCNYSSEPFVAELNKLDVKIVNINATASQVGATDIQITNPNGIFCQNDENYIYPSTKTFYDYGKLTAEWFLDGVSIGKNFKQEVTKSGTYSVKLQQGTCTGSASTKIEVIDIPKLISKDSLLICPYGSVTIEAPKLDKYTWLLNNQNFAETQSIKANKVGNYRVWLEKGECGGMSNIVKVLQKNTLPTATISGSKTINFGDSTRIKIDLTDTAPWTVKLSNSQVFITDKTPFEFSVKPSQSTTYELVSVKNECGEGTFAGKAEVKIIILGNEEIAGANIKIFPIPAQNSCQLSVETSLPESLELQLFSLDGKLISKTEISKVENLHSQTINLESAPSGTYLLKIMLGNKVVSRKIIKQN